MPDKAPSRLAAIWFADIVGYTGLSARDEDLALRLVAELQTAAEREVAAHSGRIVKFLGDVDAQAHEEVFLLEEPAPFVAA